MTLSGQFYASFCLVGIQIDMENGAWIGKWLAITKGITDALFFSAVAELLFLLARSFSCAFRV